MQRQLLYRLAGIAAVGILAAACLTPSEPAPPLTCLPPDVTTANWQTITQASVVTYKVPPTYIRQTGSNRWESGRAWVEPQLLRPGTVETDPPEFLTNATGCRASVRGRTLVIQLGRTSAAGRFGPGWYMGAHWGSVQIPGPDGFPETVALVFEAWMPSEALIEEFLAIIWSVVVTRPGT